MDRRSSRNHYQNPKLKGATRILSDQSMSTDLEQQEQLSKTPQDANVDSTITTTSTTTTTNLLDDTQKLASSRSITNNLNLNQSNNVNINRISSGCGSVGSNNSHNSTNMLYIDPQSSSSTVSSFNTTKHHQQTFSSPQIISCDIKSLFECPICFDYAIPPIYQCQNGHLVCQSCTNKITHCPTCRVQISQPSIRNLQLDRLANTFEFPCKYNFNGCQWKSNWSKKRKHEDNCDFISYSCPCPGTACKWTGLLSQVMHHLSEHHKSITTLSGEDIVFLATDINLKGAIDWVMIQSCFDNHFLLVLEKQELKTGQQQFFAVVQLIGSRIQANKYKYKLELSKNISGKIKRLQWEATPCSILDGIQVAISNYDCLVFDSKMAQHFLSPTKNDNESSEVTRNQVVPAENLGINVTIERIAPL